MCAARNLFIEGLQHSYCKIDRVSRIRFIELPEDPSFAVDEYGLCCGRARIHTEEYRAGRFRKGSCFRSFPSVPFTELGKRLIIFKERREALYFLHFRIGKRTQFIPQNFYR